MKFHRLEIGMPHLHPQSLCALLLHKCRVHIRGQGDGITAGLAHQRDWKVDVGAKRGRQLAGRY